MFGKLKNKLQNLFKKTEKIIEKKEIKKKDVKKSKILKPKKKEIIIEKIEPKKKEGFFSRLKKKKISEEQFLEIYKDIEIFLLEINVSFQIVEKIKTKLEETIIGNLYDRFSIKKEIKKVLENEVKNIFEKKEKDFLKDISKFEKPVKILILGVNGTGKTTTIAKIINYLKENKLSCVVSASDTFRAAAVEQLEIHCKNLNTKIIKQNSGADPCAVAFDSVKYAESKKIDVVLIDTAGRMPNNKNLMGELEKINRVINPDLKIFIGDSITGNDLINQIELFDEIVKINGSILTKVDTDERPGSIISVAYKINSPIYFLGIGQEYKDLIKFDSQKISKKFFEE